MNWEIKLNRNKHGLLMMMMNRKGNIAYKIILKYELTCAIQ